MSKASDNGQGRKFLKIAGIVLGSIFILLLIAQILLMTLLEPYAERYLKEQVVESTEGLYRLEFDDISINLFMGSAALTNMHLYPDSTVHRQQKEAGKASRTLIEAESPLLRVRGVNLLGILLTDHIGIGSVLLDRPVITLASDESVEEEEQDNAQTQEQPTEEGSSFMESLRVKEIRIEDGTYRHVALGPETLPRHEVPHVSFLVEDLRLDSLDQADHTRMLNADNIQVTVKDYKYSSPDSVYTISVGLFSYSTRAGELVADSVTVISDHDANMALGKDEISPSLYNIRAPRIRFTGMHAVEAFRTKRLEIESILFENTVLDMLNNENVAQQEAETEYPALEDLYKDVSEYLTYLGIGEFRLKNGSVTYRTIIDDITTIHELERADIAFQGIRVDSLTLFSPRDQFYAEEILASVEGYTYKHPKSPYTMMLGRVELSTLEKFLHADSMYLVGDREVNTRLNSIDKAHHVLYDIKAPRLRIDSMDVIQAFKTRRLDIESILLENPHITVLYDNNIPEVTSEADPEEAYKEVSDFVASLGIKQINVQDASFIHEYKDRNIIRIQELEHASLALMGFEIDSLLVFNPEAGIPLQDMVLTANNYTLRLPDNSYTLQLGSLNYSSKQQVLNARSIDLKSNRQVNEHMKQVNMDKANRNLFDVAARQFQVTGLDIIKAYNSDRLEVDQIILRQPELAIFLDRNVPEAETEQSQEGGMDGLFEMFNPISARAIRLEDGTFTYREKRDYVIRTQVLEHASASVTGLNLSPATLKNLDDNLPIEDMILTANDYTYIQPDGIYTFKLGSLRYSTKQQELTARSINIISDKEINNRYKRDSIERANRNMFDISAERFRITGLDLIRSYESGNFIISDIILNEPEIAIMQDHDIPEQSDDEGEAVAMQEADEEDNDALEQVAEIVDIFRVANVRVTDGHFKINILEDSVIRSMTVDHVSLAIEQLRMIDLEANDPLEMFDVDDIGLLVRDFTYLLPDSLYAFEVDEVRSSLRDQSLIIDSLRLVPMFKVDDFVARLQYADDRFDIKIPHIIAQGINLRELFNNQAFIIGRALVESPVVEIYRDNRVEQDPDRRPVTLQNMLGTLDMYVQIDTIGLANGKLTYSEISPDGVEPGTLIMEDMIFGLTNITNDTALIRQNNIATLHGATRFMGESKLRVRMLLDLDHPEDRYSYSGILESMDFSAFNNLSENLGGVRFESGQINKVEFDVQATEHLAVGMMRFFYNDLEIQLVNTDDPENPGALRRAGSWAINNLAVKSDNPEENHFRDGDIEVERNYQKSVFNHMSSAMIDGLTSSLMPPLVEKIVNTVVGD
jgi:hypothetical protein